MLNKKFTYTHTHTYTHTYTHTHTPVQVCHVAIDTLECLVEPYQHLKMVLLELLISVLVNE